MASIENKIESLLLEPIQELGYELYDVQYAKEGSDYFLRVFIEHRKEKITLNDCEIVSVKINDILDKADYIKEQYFLEVSSTGIEKIIRKDKHLNENIGEKILIKLYKPLNNNKEFVGVLKQFDNNNIIIYIKDEDNNKELNIERKNISLIKKYFDWNNSGGNE